MSLLDELKEKRQDAIENFETQGADIEVTREQLADQQRVRAFWAAQIVDLDKAISALTPEGKEALLDDQPEPVPTEVRKQDEQDAAVKPYRVYVENSVRGEATSLGFDTSVFALDYAQRMSASGAVTRVHVVEGMSAPNSETIFLWEAPPPPQEAPAIPEDWTRHDGGECPLRAGVDVDLRFRDGSTYFNSIGLGDFRKNWSWDCSEPAQIVAYRENQASAEAERIEDARDGTPSTEQTEHDRPKLTNEEWDKLEKVAAVDGVDQTEVVDQTNALISEENDAPTGSGAPVSSTNIAADESVPVLDATDIAEVLQKNVPGDALLATYADGKLYATFGGSTYLVIDAPEKADGFKETPERDAYAPIHNEDEPVIHPDAAFWAKALPAEAEAKAEAKKFGGIFGFGAYESRSRR